MNRNSTPNAEDDTLYRLDHLMEEAHRTIKRRVPRPASPRIAATLEVAGCDDVNDLIDRHNETIKQLQSAAQDALAATYTSLDFESADNDTNPGPSHKSRREHTDSNPQSSEILYDDVIELVDQLNTGRAQSEAQRNDSDKWSTENTISQRSDKDERNVSTEAWSVRQSHDGTDAWFTESQASSDCESKEACVDDQDEVVAGSKFRWQKVASAEVVVKSCCVQ
ncbi:hypothetical protein LTR86_008584 [Recurvomyces mirabilis]|nr:hypothetical protein LTR86_008584 [Recurvomyces mirabilis]